MRWLAMIAATAWLLACTNDYADFRFTPPEGTPGATRDAGPDAASDAGDD